MEHGGGESILIQKKKKNPLPSFSLPQICETSMYRILVSFVCLYVCVCETKKKVIAQNTNTIDALSQNYFY